VFKSILPALAIFAIACSSLAATPAKPHKRRKPPTTTVSATHARKPATAGAKTTSVKGSKTAAARRIKGKIARVPARSYQQAPTPDRYREIQQALASKGYLQTEPNGQWGPESSDALKRFQADQSLMPDGKINSLSLIALGLGPKHLTAKSDGAPPPSVTPAPAPPNQQ
jgi:peptidoglycan hydrolase-like protein with peptidoglycan-binding domain